MLVFSKYRPYIALASALVFIATGMLPLKSVLGTIDFNVLLMIKIPMKMIQDWLGHSDMGTTSNIYSHLDAGSKLDSAKAIGVALASGS